MTTKLRRSEAAILAALLGKSPVRFTDLAASTGLSKMSVNRALKRLVAGRLVLAQTVPGQAYPVKVRFTLSKRGTAAALPSSPNQEN